MNYTHILDCTSTRIMHNHFNFLSPRCPLPFPPCRRRLNPKRFSLFLFWTLFLLVCFKPLLISGGMCGSLLQWRGLIQQIISCKNLICLRNIHKYHQRTLLKQVGLLTVGLSNLTKLDFMDDCQWPQRKGWWQFVGTNSEDHLVPWKLLKIQLAYEVCPHTYTSVKWRVWCLQWRISTPLSCCVQSVCRAVGLSRTLLQGPSSKTHGLPCSRKILHYDDDILHSKQFDT